MTEGGSKASTRGVIREALLHRAQLEAELNAAWPEEEQLREGLKVLQFMEDIGCRPGQEVTEAQLEALRARERAFVRERPGVDALLRRIRAIPAAAAAALRRAEADGPGGAP